MILKFVMESTNDKLVDIEHELENDFKELLLDLEEELESVSENRTNESVALTVTGLTLAIPGILKIISTVGKHASSVVLKSLGKKPSDTDSYNKWFDKMSKLGDDLHHMYVKPIEKVVGKFVSDKDKVHRIADGIMHLIIAMMFVASGIGTIQHLSSSHLSSASLEAALTAVKGNEIKLFIKNLFS